MRGEEWRRIPGFPNYEVSNLGRVRSYLNNRWGVTDSPRVLSPKRKKKPESLTEYRQLQLTDELGTSRLRMVHQLVLAAFIGPRPHGMVSRHLNGDGTDNRLANLCYGTPRENALDNTAHGNNPWANRTHCNHGHPLVGENVEPRRDHGGRVCVTCKRAAWKRKNERAKARRRDGRAA